MHPGSPARATIHSLVTCEGCRYFRPDAVNPPAGLGWCELRKVSRYPMQPHYCKQREGENDDTTRNDA